MDLPHLKLSKTGNAKYRRRITSPQLRAVLGKSAVEWSLKTRDPLEIVDAWKVQHAKFEAMQAKAEGRSTESVEWDMLLKAAVAHGLAEPNASKIGPVDSQLESGKFDAFTAAALAEAEKMTPQEANARFANKPPANPFSLLADAQLFGVQRPDLVLSTVVNSYLKDRERKSSYDDLSKQVNLVVAGLEDAMDADDPPVRSINKEAAYAYRDALIAKGNAYGTLRRRVTTIKAVLNHGKDRFDITDWENPFVRLTMPDDDGVAGEVKRYPLTLEDIRKVRDCHTGLNDNAKDIWHLMMFTGLGPNEARGVLWSEVHLDHPTPHFEIRANGLRRLKVGERQRRIPLVGSALTMMQGRRKSTAKGTSEVFPRYAHHRTSNSLSNTLIKPMKKAEVWAKIHKVPYSLRHSIKDMLRRTAPATMQSLLMGHGHGQGGSADGYGDDDLLDLLAGHLETALATGGVFDYPVLPDPKANT